MEAVETCEGPTRQPYEWIVASGEYPDDGDVRKGKMSGTIGDVPAELFIFGWPTVNVG